MNWSLNNNPTGGGLPPWTAAATGGLMIIVSGALTLGDGTGSSVLSRSQVQRAASAGRTTSGVTERPVRAIENRAKGVAVEPRFDGVGADPSSDTAKLIQDLRSRSGLTWDQLASIFGVDRRSIHFWSSGRPMNAANAERLARVLAVIGRIDKGDPSVTRAWLLTPTANGSVPLDLLREDRGKELVGDGVVTARPTNRAPAISPAAAGIRAPRPPATLLGANQEPLRGSAGRLINSTRLRSKKPT
jgi:transcriptional regulator with XRE-family HTH domain